MNTFVEQFLEEENKTLTDNGALTYKSTRNKNLDFFSMASAMRGKQQEVMKLFIEAWKEDKNLAIKNVFYLRDVREGQGERTLFRICLSWVFQSLVRENNIEAIKRLALEVKEFGRWDDLISLISENICNDIIRNIISDQLREDVENMKQGKSISLLAKWFPLSNSVSNITRKKIGKYLAKSIFSSNKECRHTLVSLRNYLEIIEQKISANEWDKIKYETVPSLAGIKYSKAFSRHDEERYRQFLTDVSNGNAKINTSVLYPYEIIDKFIDFSNRWKPVDDENYLNTLNLMWDNLPDYTNGQSAICVVDTSGSMMSGYGRIRPISVAISLGMYFAERNKSDFKNIVFTFSNEPTCLKISGNTGYEKCVNLMNDGANTWGMNTNIEAVFDLYLTLAQKSNKEDLPKSIIIISDMEFDSCGLYTNFQKINQKFTELDIQRPTLCFWNVNARGNNVPCTAKDNNIVLVSGCSPNLFKFIMENKNPVKFMLDVLGTERYKNIFIK